MFERIGRKIDYFISRVKHYTELTFVGLVLAVTGIILVIKMILWESNNADDS